MSEANQRAWDAYFWPNSDVLRNKLDIRDADRLANTETLLATQRIAQGFPPLAVSARGYRAIHAHIFQDLYDWAGTYRTANMRHPAHDMFFCNVQFIPAQMEAVFDQLAGLRGRDLSPAGFAAAIAAPMGDLNAIHPFREGNGRAMRAFIDQFADTFGLVFDQTQLAPDRWNEASRINFQTADPEPMRAIIASAVRDRGRDLSWPPEHEPGRDPFDD